MEAAFGRSFDDVDVRCGAATSLSALGAEAAARGNQIAFAAESPSPWLVAHELTHVEQGRCSAASGLGRTSTIAPPGSAAEREADRVADRVASGLPAGPIESTATALVHLFSPRWHESATIMGLTGDFSAEETAEIYSANWERDFSQGHPAIANAVLAWIALKNAASHGEDLAPTASAFKSAVWTLIDTNLLEGTRTSLGGYQTWEHMDKPGWWARRDADKLWAGKSNGIAGYILDSRAYIKDQIVAAIDAHRASIGRHGVGGNFDTWEGVATPDAYDSQRERIDGFNRVCGVEGGTGPTFTRHLPRGWDDTSVAPRDPLREQTRIAAREAAARSVPDGADRCSSESAQHLGRAMHALEDFWAHSNWLELARVVRDTKRSVTNAELATGDFTTPSQADALGHKLLMLAGELQEHLSLLTSVYGLQAPSDKLQSPQAKKAPLGPRASRGLSDHERAYGALRRDSWWTWAELLGVGEAADDVEELVQVGGYTMGDFLSNRDWLNALAQKGQALVDQGRANASGGSHGAMAKDDADHKDHALALRIATEANRLVFGPLARAMREPDWGKAFEAVRTQSNLIDTMVQAPSESHPLFHLVVEDKS